MQKVQRTKTRKVARSEMLAEYRFDYRKAKSNRFAGRADSDRVIVVLDPDVSEVFSTPQTVNTALRALITAMPTPPKPKRSRQRKSGTER